MSEAWSIALTAIATVIGGIAIYTIGHFFEALFIEPIHQLRSLIGEIADSLVFYANIYSNPDSGKKEDMDEAGEVLRRHASQLSARAKSVPWYPFWSFWKLVPRKKTIEEASSELIGLSNSIHRAGEYNSGIENDERRKKIESSLGI